MSQPRYRYPGLQPFEANEASLFFGRSAESRTLCHQVMVERLVVLFAKSGMGKTSLLNAGLLPLLSKSELLPAYVRFNDTARTLHAQFLQKMEAAGVVFDPQYAGKTLWEQLKYARASKHGRPATSLIILDQFEEIFTLYTPEQRQPFVQELADVANRKIPETIQAALLRLVQDDPEVSDATLAELERQPPVRIIFSIRSDLLHLLNGLSAQIPDILRSRYELLALSEKGAEEAILLPAALAGDFASPPFRYDDAALAEIRSELSQQGQKNIESFQLQIICQAIEKLVIDQSTGQPAQPFTVSPPLYGGAAGIQRLLTDFYTNKVEELPVEQRLAARQIIEEALITESERRRSMDENDLLQGNPGASTGLLNQLVEMRLLRKEPRLESYYYEISHDTLVPPILVKYKERRREEERVEDLERRRQEQAALAAQLAAERKKRARARRYTAFALSLAAIAVAAMFYALWLRNVAVREKRHAFANDLAYKSQIALRDGDRSAAFQLAALAQDYVESGNLQVLNALTAALYYNDFPDDPARLRLPWNYALEGHAGPVRSVAFSPDGKTVATGSEDNTARIWNPETGETILTLEGHRQHVKALAFSPDGATLATGSDDNTAKIWDLKTGKALMTLEGQEESVTSVAFSPDGKNLAVGLGDNTIKIWNPATNSSITLTGGHSEDVRSLAFSPDGKTLATASDDYTVIIWDLRARKPLITLRAHGNQVRSVAFSPDGTTLATGSDDGTAKVWDLKARKVMMTLHGHSNFVSSVAFSPDGKQLATGSEDKTALIWDLKTGKKVMKLAGHHAPICSVAFSPDGKRLLTGAEDHTARIWDLNSGGAATLLQGHLDSISSIAFSVDGKKCATGSLDHTVHICDAHGGQALMRLEGHSGPVTSIAFSPDGTRLATASDDHTAKIWDLASGKEIRALPGHRQLLSSIAFSPDGKWLATASADSTAKIWDIGDRNASGGPAVHTLQGHSGGVTSVAFSPDGNRLATGSADHTVKIWDWKSGKVLATLQGHSQWVSSVAFSPDGKYLATGSWDNTAQIWDLKTNKAILTLLHLNGRVLSVAFSPDGQRLVTGAEDWIARIWNLKTGETMLTFEGHTDEVNSAVFSPDGKRLATASADSTAKIWELDADAMIGRLHSERRLAALSRQQLEDWNLEGLLDIKPGNEDQLRSTGTPNQLVAFADLCAQKTHDPAELARAMRLYESAAQNGTASIRQLVAQRYSELGKNQLYLADSQAAVTTLERGRVLDPANPHLPVLLAPALLLQGRYAEAEKIYLEYLDKPYQEGTYRDAFQQDLEALEERGISHPDMARIRARLTK